MHFQVSRWFYEVDESNSAFESIEEVSEVEQVQWIAPFFTAVEQYRRQMIVLQVTYLELMITDFLTCLFYANPRRMYQFLGDDNKTGTQGKVDLIEILDTPSIELLVNNLAEKAASKIMRGKFETMIRHLQTLGKFEIEDEMEKKFVKLNSLRNEIVHEGFSIKISSKEVSDNFINILDFLESLHQVAELNDIEIE